MDTRRKIVGIDEALRAADGKRIIWVRGYFDPLLAEHAGRIDRLAAPGALVVILLDDPPEPLLATRARAELVAGLARVDYVLAGHPAAPDAGLPVIELNDAVLRSRLMERIRERHGGAGV